MIIILKKNALRFWWNAIMNIFHFVLSMSSSLISICESNFSHRGKLRKHKKRAAIIRTISTETNIYTENDNHTKLYTIFKEGR